jgi:hypothetical protein
MPVYEYEGQHYDIDTTDQAEAKNKILAHLGKSVGPVMAAEDAPDFTRGISNIVPQLQNVASSAKALTGVVAKKMGFDETGDSLLASGLKGMKASEAEMVVKDSDEFTEAWEKGIGTVITDWLPYQAGAGVGSLLETLGFMAVGAVAGGVGGAGVGAIPGAVGGAISKTLIKQGINFADYFDGILYGAKSQSSMGSALGLGASKPAGTSKTAVVYNQNLLTFQGVSTDGINYKIPSKETSKLTSPELSLVNGEIPEGSVIKKTMVDLKGKKILSLPNNLEIIGSLDLRNPSINDIPPNLKVKNTLYILPSQINSFLSIKPQIKRLWVDSLTPDIIKILTQSGLTYVPQPWDKPEEDSYSGTFKI